MARTRSAAAAVENSPAPTGAYPAWSRSVKEVLDHFEVTPARGLSQAQVQAARALYGFNELKKEQSKPLWKLILEQFDDPLVKARPINARGRLPLDMKPSEAECASRSVAPRRLSRRAARAARLPHASRAPLSPASPDPAVRSVRLIWHLVRGGG
jgi:hypothetical protein